MPITIEFRSTYRGIAWFNVFGLPDVVGSRTVEYLYWSPRQYRDDFASGGWNYTAEAWEKARCVQSGRVRFLLGSNGEVPAEVVALVKAACCGYFDWKCKTCLREGTAEHSATLTHCPYCKSEHDAEHGPHAV